MKNNYSLLIVLDGYGLSDSKEYNAIKNSNSPFLQNLFNIKNKFSILKAHGEYVGLPTNQEGNSEVGHLHLGSGRIVKQGLSLIDEEMKKTNFIENNKKLYESINNVKANKGNIHLLGLLSKGGVHSHEKHIFKMIDELLKLKINKIYIHAILDGRDVPPKSALSSLGELQLITEKSNNKVNIATICGRYYTMDRDNRWERIKLAYDLIINKIGNKASNINDAINDCYSSEETDEFIKPILCCDFDKITNKDLLIVMNFRADRARQITEAIKDPIKSFYELEDNFDLKNIPQILTLTEYSDNLKELAIYPQEILKNTLGEIISKNNLRQIRISETEKFAHVTYFFNGNLKKPFNFENRKLIHSNRDVKTYDLAPEMRCMEISEEVINSIKSKEYNFILCNFANADMVGHTGNYKETINSLEILDKVVSSIIKISIKNNINTFITADHGNAECMFNKKINQPNTSHTSNPVPLFYIGNYKKKLKNSGRLIDVAPTILEVMGIDKPKEMTGLSLWE